MNLKSFPGPQPHIRVSGVVVGETGREEGMVVMEEEAEGRFAARLLGGPYVPVLGGTPATEVPKAGALARAMGAGCPSCLLTLPSLCSTPVWAGGVLMMGFVQTRQCLLPCQSSSRLLTHTHMKTDTRIHRIQTQAAGPGRAHPLTSTSSQPSQASHHLISQRQPLHCLLFALFWALHNLHSKLRTAPAPFFAQSTTCLWRPVRD